MKCQECELLLAQGESSPQLENHLRDCAGCRGLADALAANVAALESLRQEELPRIIVKTPHRRVYAYAAAIAAVAAALITGIEVPRPRAVAPAPPPPAVIAPPLPAPVVNRKPQPLRIKMLTPDPEVVIYWIVD